MISNTYLTTLKLASKKTERVIQTLRMSKALLSLLPARQTEQSGFGISLTLVNLVLREKNLIILYKEMPIVKI